MRIAHIISVMAEADGHSLYCRRLCEELAGCGHACSVCCGEDPELQPMALPATVPVRRLPAPSRLAQAGSVRLRREVDKFLAGARPELVHIHGLWHPLVHVGVACARRRGVPILTSLHGMARPCALRIGHWKKWMAWRVYQRHDLRSAAMLHAMTSQEAGDPLCSRLGVPICIVPMGVDIAAQQPRRVSGDDRRVVYLGRMHPGKGLMELLDAWAAVRPPGWMLVLAGPDERGHMAELRRKVEDRGMIRDVIWCGPVYDGNRERLFAETDLLVLPSRSESFGAVVGEALARGIPVIATKGAPWEVVQSGGCGWWVDFGVEPLARALRDATGLSDGQRAEMGARGRDMVRQRYAWSAVGAQMATVYDRALRNSSILNLTA